MDTKNCDICNSVIITVKKGNSFVAECSYCGEPYEKGIVIEHFLDEYNGEDYNE